MLILNFKISFHSAQHQKYQTALFMKIQKSTWIHGVKSLIGMTLMMDGMKKEGRLSYLKMNETCCNPKECLHHWPAYTRICCNENTFSAL